MNDNVHSLRPPRVPWNPELHIAVAGAVFVSPAQFGSAAQEVVRGSMIKSIVVQALAEAANEYGEVLDYHPRDFFHTHIANALEHDDEAPPLVYDAFTAMTLMECMSDLLLCDGLLANRGNGGSTDYRLTLPPPAQRG